MAMNYEEWEYSSYRTYLQVKVSDTCFPKIAINSTLKLFRTKNDTSGLEGFKAEHERFKVQ